MSKLHLLPVIWCYRINFVLSVISLIWPGQKKYKALFFTNDLMHSFQWNCYFNLRRNDDPPLLPLVILLVCLLLLPLLALLLLLSAHALVRRLLGQHQSHLVVVEILALGEKRVSVPKKANG